jgi:hypothetical protein
VVGSLFAVLTGPARRSGDLLRKAQAVFIYLLKKSILTGRQQEFVWKEWS